MCTKNNYAYMVGRWLAESTEALAVQITSQDEVPHDKNASKVKPSDFSS